MRIKRFLATTLSTALIAGMVFTGCGDTNEATTEATTATTVATTEATTATTVATEATTESTEATTEATTADTGSIGVANDAERDVTVDRAIELAGMAVSVPDYAENVTYNVLSVSTSPVSEAVFTADGNTVSARMSATSSVSYDDSEAESVSGMYGNWETKEAEVGYCTAKVYTADGAGYVAWLDVVPGILYTVSMTEGVDEDASNLIKYANDIFDPIQQEDDNSADLGFYEGNYNDTYSGRAYATVEKNDDDTLHILVHWGGSATEYAQWEMNATVDNGSLVYSDSKKTNCTTADDEAGETVEVVYENGTGYFNDENGSLYWSGSEDESCRDCVFERVPTEE